VVLTRQPGWSAPGALCAPSLAEACALCPPDIDAWVIGGAEIYAQALPLASSAVVTEIDASFDGDAFAPQFGPEWTETAREQQLATNGLCFSFVTYRRNTGV
jgi:dihydrofolate reductase